MSALVSAIKAPVYSLSPTVKMVSVLLGVFVSSLIPYGFAGILPPEVVTCKRNDPNIDECVRDAIQKSLAALYVGIPNLGLEVLDPLKIDSLIIDRRKNNGAPVDIDLEWQDVTIIGIKSAKFSSAKVNWNEGTISFEAEFMDPLHIFGTYTVDGVVLILPIHGDGKFDLNLEGFKSHIKIHGHEEEKEGEKYFIVDKLAYTFDISHMSIKYENLFNGDKILGPSMNSFLNENWGDILQEMTPSIEASFSSHFQEVAKNFFGRVPMSEIAPP